MMKVAIVILAGKETHEAMGRCTNALVAARELKESGHDVKIIFDGAGTEWVPELEKEDNRMHGIYRSVKGSISGVCEFCAGAFNVKEAIGKTGVKFLPDYMGHPSFTGLMEEGYQVITF